MLDRNTERLILIDGNNLVLRASGGYKSRNKETGEWEPLMTSDGRVSSALYGSFSIFQQYVKLLQPSHVLWFFDHGKSKARLAIRDTYKANRDKYKEKDKERIDLRPQYQSLKQLLGLIGVSYHSEEGVEADDLIANASYKWPDIQKVIISADHDLLQLVNEKTHVLKPQMTKSRDHKLYTHEKIVEEFELTPRELPELWSLMGDSGDGIDGLPRVGPKTALKMMKEYGNLNNIIATHPKLEGWEKFVAENYDLINLTGEYATLDMELGDTIFTRDLQVDSLRKFFYDWEFNSYLQKLDHGRLF